MQNISFENQNKIKKLLFFIFSKLLKCEINIALMQTEGKIPSKYFVTI